MSPEEDYVLRRAALRAGKIIDKGRFMNTTHTTPEMRDAFEAALNKLSPGRNFNRNPDGTYCYWVTENDWMLWQAAQSQPAPPVPASAQEIMPLLNAYVRACAEFDASIDDLDEAEDEVNAAFAPLETALTALVEENHRLKFELDGVRAMRGPEWQPIETAPKDGPLILLGLPADNECDGVALPGWWQEAYDDAPDEMGSDAGFVDCFFQYFRPGRSFGTEAYRDAGIQPTHWQPMPTSPTPGIEPEQGEVK